MYKTYIGLILASLMFAINTGYAETGKFKRYLEGECSHCENPDKLIANVSSPDFCVIGKTHIQNRTPLPNENSEDKTTKYWSVTGIIKVENVIYGNPEIQDIHFSVIEYAPSITWRHFTSNWLIIPVEGSYVIVLGNGKKDSINVTRAFGVGDSPAGGSTRFIGEIYRMLHFLKESDMNTTSLQQAQSMLIAETKKLLSEGKDTNFTYLDGAFVEYQYVFYYLFQKIIDNEGINGALSFLETLLGDEISGKDAIVISTCNMEVEHLLECHYQNKYFDSDQKEQLGRISPRHARLTALAGNLTAEQRQRIRNIIEKYFLWFKSQKLLLIDIIKSDIDKIDWILQEDSELRNRIKKISKDLSEQFKNDKNYPEWQKWVNKIFPDDKEK